jgi:hypothetical protein
MANEHDHKKVLEEIDELKSMMPGGLFAVGKPDWKQIWNQVRTVGASFKGVRFPTHDEHQEAWDRFQSLVNTIKEAQAEEQEQWEEKKSRSGQYRNEIITEAEMAKPSGPLGDVILTIATGGINVVLDALLGPFDERRRELQACSEHLRKGWALLNEHKGDMLAQDKREAYQALCDAGEQLNQAWEDYKGERQKAYDDSRAERQRNHDEWVQKIEANIEKLEARTERLNEIISRKEDHLDELHSKLDDAWNDDYRDRVSGWIDEEETRLAELRSQLADVENWLNEDRSKLR